MKNFKLLSLVQNLSHGLGSNLVLPKLPKTIIVQVGEDSFGKMLSLLLVNEFPRLYHANPDLKFHISRTSESALKVETDNGVRDIVLSDRTGVVFNSLVESL